MNKLLEILKQINDSIEYEKESNLVDDGLFSSFDILQCVSAIEENYGVEVPISEIRNENFNSLENISNMIERLKK
ncbi:acyl carrier protein [Candidatus Campylobacter infans]|uniref:Acyl carrier protein n=1 Tax=Candidatus Campylobacter infans TaxID=2561898 RepID=A0A7H9CGU7_9BACT|nr:acyl carrier protein [Candidatus Campylobacter infans]QLI05353.1 acyl carrier protein [Candidatus Campylobacter infans]